MLGARQACEGVQVVDDVLEIGDEGALPLTQAVSEVVFCVYGESVPGQLVGNVGIPGAVFGVAVNQDHNPDGLARRYPPVIHDVSFRPGETQLAHDHPFPRIRSGFEDQGQDHRSARGLRADDRRRRLAHRLL